MFDHLDGKAAERERKNEKNIHLMFLMILAMVFFFCPKLLKNKQSMRS